MSETRITGNVPLPGPSVTVLPGPGSSNTVESLRAHFRTVWRRKWIVLLVVFLIIGGGALYTYFQPRVYQASAFLVFTHRSSGAFRGPVRQEVTGNFLNTQKALLRRPEFLNEIIRDPELALAKSPSFRNEPDLAGALGRAIRVGQISGTNILSIRMEGEDPKLITETVNTIAHRRCAYLERDLEESKRAAVQEHGKKMEQIDLELSAINDEIWRRANEAGIRGLTFGKQQRDRHVIEEAFRRRRDWLVSQRAAVDHDLYEARIDLASKARDFGLLCDSYIRDAEEAAVQPEHPGATKAAPREEKTPPRGVQHLGADRGATASAGAGTGTVDPEEAKATSRNGASGTDGRPGPKAPVTSAAQLARLYKERQALTAELEKSFQDLVGDPKDNPLVTSLEKRRATLDKAIEQAHRAYRKQERVTEPARRQRQAAQEWLALSMGRIQQIEKKMAVCRRPPPENGPTGPPAARALQRVQASLRRHQELVSLLSDLAGARQAMADTRGGPATLPSEGRQAKLRAALEQARLKAREHQEAALSAFKEHEAADKKIASLKPRMKGLDERLEMYRRSLTDRGVAGDPKVRSLQHMRDLLREESEREQKRREENEAKLQQVAADAQTALQQITDQWWPQMNAELAELRAFEEDYREDFEKRQATQRQFATEAPKIRALGEAARALGRARFAPEVLTGYLKRFHAELEQLSVPLTDILNMGARAERLAKSKVQMEQWIHEVKLGLDQIAVRVDEASQPRMPIRPDWLASMKVYAVLGLMAGVGLALLLETGRGTVRTPADVTHSLSARPLGVVPHFEALDVHGGVLSLEAAKDPHVGEAFNDVRFSIGLASGQEPPRALLVTSATAAEGKSTVAIMLAYSFARAGEKVLLVDGNIRQPYLHYVFKTAPSLGLADVLDDGPSWRAYIRSTRAPNAYIQATGVPNLFFVAAGRASEDGLSTHDPDRLREFVRAANERFDRVIFDASSVIGVVDARTMAAGIGAVLYVVESERRNRALIQRAVGALVDVKADIVGIIINNARYTKGDYHHFRKRVVDRNGRVSGLSEAAEESNGRTSRHREVAQLPPPSREGNSTSEAPDAPAPSHERENHGEA